MPSTPLSYITTGMRFISWVPADEELMRLSFRCVVRNGIRRFQIADPATTPSGLRRVAQVASEEGVEEIVDRSDVLDQPGAHARVLRRARRPPRRLRDRSTGCYLKDPGRLL
jgi:oxaloacetate decarboxylase alpha subunit